EGVHGSRGLQRLLPGGVGERALGPGLAPSQGSALVEQELAAHRVLRRLDDRAPGFSDVRADPDRRLAGPGFLHALLLAIRAQDFAMLGLVRLEQRLLDLAILPLLGDEEW